MAEENRVTTKNPKKVEVGRRLAEYNHRKREELKAQKSEVEPKLTSSMCYGIGSVLAVGVIGGFGYYLHQAKKREDNNIVPHHQPSPQQHPKANKFEME